ncbi:Zinc/iron permease [Elaphomyces granulatus]
MDNNTRAWLLSSISGGACILGSSIVCIDLLLQRCCGTKNFQIATSNTFLSSALSLSAGVLLFSSLYSMLPTSSKYLVRAGWSESAAAYALIGFFVVGSVGLRLVSNLLHRYIPSHIVDCHHGHEPDKTDLEQARPEDERHRRHNHHHHHHPPNGSTEHTPLLPRQRSQSEGLPRANSRSRSRKPQRRQWLGGTTTHSDENGTCYGFSPACPQTCLRLSSTSFPEPIPPSPLQGDVDAVLADSQAQEQPVTDIAETVGQQQAPDLEPLPDGDSHWESSKPRQPLMSATEQPHQHHHHHHVPNNAFLSIGLQTSLAIALHKLPEGLITYATNYANPTLGLTVFLALFIHNITDGFALALPLYLALNSRWKAILWSSLLGGLSQPAGAGIAALWIWWARRAGDVTAPPPWGLYGGVFAVTAGIMTSVGLQLLGEGLRLTHHQGLCIGSAIAGMGVVGVSFALTK